jgi:hypothetical protein
MFEYLGEQIDPKNIGTFEFNTEHEAPKRPLWLVLLKLFGLLAMLPIGYVLVIPLLPLPAWQSISVASGILLIYIGLAFFVRPEPDTDNLGWAGGLVDDPFHYSDDANRWLLLLHCALGPGRFASEAILDACALLGVTKTVDKEAVIEEADRAVAVSGATVPPLAADRFESNDDYDF